MDRRDLRDGYDRSAPLYGERFRELQRPKLDAVLARVKPGARALDVGCGTGFLLERVPHAVGLDLSLEMLRRAPGVKVQGDALALPFREGAFDTVFAITSFLMADVTRALVEVHRVLRGGGTFALTLLVADVPRDFERELRAAGFVVKDRFECGQDRGWICARR